MERLKSSSKKTPILWSDKGTQLLVLFIAIVAVAVFFMHVRLPRSIALRATSMVFALCFMAYCLFVKEYKPFYFGGMMKGQML